VVVEDLCHFGVGPLNGLDDAGIDVIDERVVAEEVSEQHVHDDDSHLRVIWTTLSPKTPFPLIMIITLNLRVVNIS
jgi:hypothetical protein